MSDNICKVIAEVGSTWLRSDPESSRQSALDSIRTAKECGADIVKFQMLTPDGPWSKDRASDKWEATRPYWLPPEWLPSLRTLAANVGVEFWLSFFDLKAINDYARFCTGLKVASGELSEMGRPILCALAKQAERYNIPLAISTGTHAEAEVAQALDWLKDFSIEVILMNCVSKYPANVSDYDLIWPLKYQRKYWNWLRLGLSDHTITAYPDDISFGEARLTNEAIRLGYTYFEKHLKTLGTPRSNPDYRHSLSPKQLTIYIEAIRKAECQWLEVEKQLAPGEEGERAWMQRGSDGKRPRDA